MQIRVSNEGNGELRAQLGLGGPSFRIVEVAPGLMRSEDGAYLAFHEDEQGRLARLDVSGGISDPGGAERLHWYEQARWQLPVLIAAACLFLLRAAGTALGALWRRMRKSGAAAPDNGAASKAWRIFGWTSWNVLACPLLVIAWLASAPFPVTSAPWILPALATLVLVGAGFTLCMGAFTTLAWARRDGSLARRLVLGLASCLSLAALAVLSYWNLLGFRF